MDKLKNLAGLVVIGLFLFVGAYAGFVLAYRGIVYPRVDVGGVSVGGFDKERAREEIEAAFLREPNVTKVIYQGKELFEVGIMPEYDFVWASEQAFRVGRNGNVLTKAKETLETLFSGRQIEMPVRYDESEVDEVVEKSAELVEVKSEWPRLMLNGDKIEVEEGTNGIEIDKDYLKSQIANAMRQKGNVSIEIRTRTVNVEVSADMAEKAISALEKWRGRKLRLSSTNDKYDLSFEEMVSLLGISNRVIEPAYFANLLAKIQARMEVEARDAVFVFEDGKVKEFKPEVVGEKIDIAKFEKQIAETLLEANKVEMQVPMIQTLPKIKAGDINNLGIEELLGEGKSSFTHSIPSRVFNVNLASSRINSTLVPPGEEFSFNRSVGDISKASGYQTAYIISGGKTVLGDGGGVCQVSTTVFRAALDAGLPIVERKAHAYRVSYYEEDGKPGLDATVFSPTADFRFKNDTKHHILVQSEVDTVNRKMRVGIYGTKDERVAFVSEPVVTGVTPPPSAMYVDDPTLPRGVIKQIDWSAWGAKVSFKYKVTRGDEVLIDRVFLSNYQPWQAVYLKGTM